MAIPLYNMLMSRTMPQVQPQPQRRPPQFSPMAFMQALRNPVAFVKQQIPDIPDAIVNDPNQVLVYLQQMCGFTNEQVQQAATMVPPGMR